MTFHMNFPAAIVNAAAKSAAFDAAEAARAASAKAGRKGLGVVEHRKVLDSIGVASRLARAAERGRR